jgi:hypothetical protein
MFYFLIIKKQFRNIFCLVLQMTNYDVTRMSNYDVKRMSNDDVIRISTNNPIMMKEKGALLNILTELKTTVDFIMIKNTNTF